MEIKMIGVGGAFDYQWYNSAAIIEISGKKVLLDCGNRVYSRLRELDMADGIDQILITHLHDDHVGSLSSLILHGVHLEKRDKPVELIFPDPEFREQLNGFLSFSLGQPEKFFRFVDISETGYVEAINTFGMHVEDMQTYGYLFKDGDKTLAYSGDLGNSDVIFDYLRERNYYNTTVYHDICFYEHVDAHCYYKAVEKHLNGFKIIGYHNDPDMKPADLKIPLAKCL